MLINGVLNLLYFCISGFMQLIKRMTLLRLTAATEELPQHRLVAKQVQFWEALKMGACE